MKKLLIIALLVSPFSSNIWANNKQIAKRLSKIGSEATYLLRGTYTKRAGRYEVEGWNISRDKKNKDHYVISYDIGVIRTSKLLGHKAQLINSQTKLEQALVECVYLKQSPDAYRADKQFSMRERQHKAKKLIKIMNKNDGLSKFYYKTSEPGIKDGDSRKYSSCAVLVFADPTMQEGLILRASHFFFDD